MKSVAAEVAITHQQCLICGGLVHRPVFEESGIQIVRCCECRHVFSMFDGDPHYEGFWGTEVVDSEHAYWDAARAPMYKHFMDRFVRGRSGRLLDIGCGLGFFVKAMAAYPQWEAVGCEVSPAAVRFARESLGLHNIVCSKLDAGDWKHRSFNVVTLWDVLDHLRDPDPVLRHCRDLLVPGGMCFIRAPNVWMQLPRARLKRLARGIRSGGTYLQARDHFHHYSPVTVRKLLERNGFSDVQLIHLPPVASTSHSFPRSRQLARAGWFALVSSLARATAGHLNVDNLFVIGLT
jgi:SAM-dependent methyltransferase